MTKEQLLFQIANIGYSTSYGRDKCYATSDIASKGTWRISIFGVYFAILALTVLISGTYIAPQRGRRRRKRQADASFELT